MPKGYYAHQNPEAHGVDGLTPTEFTIFKMMAEQGLSSIGVAEALCISVSTARSHRAVIYEKLGITGVGKNYSCQALLVHRYLDYIKKLGVLCHD